MEKIVIRVLDFTEDPGPRYIRQDVPGTMTSGEAYYLTVLNKEFARCYLEKKQLVIALDGVSGYPSSFLDEAIGELVYDFSKEVVSRLLDFETVMYKKRVTQVKEETYTQWETRRIKKDPVVHSPDIHYTIQVPMSDTELMDKTI